MFANSCRPTPRRFQSPHQPAARTQLLSNGRYAVMMTSAGSGYSRWGDLAVTRWREDPTCDCWGSYIFLRDADRGTVWSAGYQPSGVEPDRYEATFLEDHVDIVRRDGTITTRLEVIVSPEDDAEARRVTISNEGRRTREIEVTSYAEVVLATGAADGAHPAFSNLFVQTEFVADIGALLATRRRRSPDEPTVWAAHLAVVDGEAVGSGQFETDRARFLGRGRGIHAPISVIDGRPLSNTAGAVLDPVFSLRRRIRLAPGAAAHITFWTLIAASRRDVLGMADKHHDSAAFERARTLAWTLAQVQLFHLGIGPDEAGLFQRLASHVLYASPALRPSSEVLARSAGGPPALWAHGISGDVPIVVCRIDDIADVHIVRQLLQAHEYWRMKQLPVDLVIVNEHAPSYAQDLQAALEAMVRAAQSRRPAGSATAQGAVFVLRADLVSLETRTLLQSAARAVLFSRRGTLFEQVRRVEEQVRRVEESAPAPGPRPSGRSGAPAGPSPGLVRPDLEFFNGLGGFAAGGREYTTILGRSSGRPPLDQRHRQSVVRLPDLGRGWGVHLGHQQPAAPADTLVERSGERPARRGALRPRRRRRRAVDADGAADSRGRGPLCRRAMARATAGSSTPRTASHSTLLQYVPSDDPVKISRLTITNQSGRSRRLSITAYVEWVLGPSRAGSAPFVVTEIDPETRTMLARNHWSTGFEGRVAFADLGGRQTVVDGRPEGVPGRPRGAGFACRAGSRRAAHQSGRWRPRSLRRPPDEAGARAGRRGGDRVPAR